MHIQHSPNLKRRASDHPADGFATGVALFIFILVMVLYVLGM